jgi:NitT/TauT family transport system substrate-binding protein
VLNERGIVMSGDALQGGIGALTDRRWKEFYDSMVAVGVLPPGLDVGRTHTLEFVNKGIGKP